MSQAFPTLGMNISKDMAMHKLLKVWKAMVMMSPCVLETSLLPIQDFCSS